MTKICSKCKTEKPKAEFSKDARSKDGRQLCCKQCNKEYRAANKASIAEKDRRYRDAHRDEIAEMKKAWAEANKSEVASKRKAHYAANSEAIKSRVAEYQARNKEVVAARRRAYSEANRDKRRDYYEANKKRMAEKARSINQRRRARKSNAEGRFTTEDILALFEKQSGCCVYCLCDIALKYHIDHIIALAIGGTNWPSNLQLLCPSCNISKHTKTHLEFILYRIALGRFVAPDLIPDDLFI